MYSIQATLGVYKKACLMFMLSNPILIVEMTIVEMTVEIKVKGQPLTVHAQDAVFYHFHGSLWFEDFRKTDKLEFGGKKSSVNRYISLHLIFYSPNSHCSLTAESDRMVHYGLCIIISAAYIYI